MPDRWVPRASRNCVRHAFHRGSVAALNRATGSPRTGYATFAMIALRDHWRENASDELRFLAFCASMRHLAFGQILQDLWVLFESDLAPAGYFVEFGAHDGVGHSNTKLLEERFGWTGILAEPNPQMTEVLRTGRSALVDPRCVWSSTGATVELAVAADGELSTITAFAQPDLHTATRRLTTVASVAVPTVSLNDLLDEHESPADFDFLSVDTEGTELNILEAFDFTPHRPRLVAVEHNGRHETQRKLDALMAANGYQRRFRHLSDWDAWYRSNDEPQATRRMTEG